MTGKGSAPRPYSVPFERFDKAFNWAFGITCNSCEYQQINQGKEGHCYMFREKPTECAQFKKNCNGE